MSDEMSHTFEFPHVDPVHAAITPVQRVWDGLRHPENHKQAFRFLCVGASGYVVNNLAFALMLHAFGVQHTVSFWVAALIGTANNFWWNRSWTFDAKHHHVGKTGLRFLLVSALVAGLAYLIYLGLVSATGMDKVLANALAYVIATPFSFLAQKLWSFKA